ncbi:hypothetical protein NDK47_07020 [Brevibacillus ruminantium]|uniref:DUF4783 domain-containing protein n=1 Tax=Brevibacillus ruminantium TaxID=2950604 RepID=A0ABY4WIQ4_9BACL|nr:hypothetical protein [Brevibacillus ruminantium]USG67035.1 hypothetical protein NDK47_07020 [Brevibacillus ruminantium]
MRQKKIPLLVALPLFLIIWLAVAQAYQSPERIVQDMIEKVQTGTGQELDLPQEDIETVRAFFQYASDQHLDSPVVEIKQLSRTQNEAQVGVSFHTVEYGTDNTIKAIHDGNLLFTLQKRTGLAWSVTEMKILKKMKKNTAP